MTRQKKLIVYSSVAIISSSYLAYRSIRKGQIYDEMIVLINSSGGGEANIQRNISALSGRLHTEILASNPDKNIIMLSQEKVKQKAEELEEAIDGIGTNKSEISAVISYVKDKFALSQIASYYRAKYNETLEDALRGDLNANDYRELITNKLSKLPTVRFS